MTEWFKWVMGNLKAPELTLPGTTHDWLKRRDRIVDVIVAEKPLVLSTVETGDLNVGSNVPWNEEVRWYESQFAAKGWPLKLCKVLGSDGVWRRTSFKWRYIWCIESSRTKVLQSGVYTMPSRLDGDAKHMAWSAIKIDGYTCLFPAVHVENQGGDALKVQQTKEAFAMVSALREQYDAAWSRVFWYEDTNTPSGAVQRWLESTPLSDLKLGAGYTSGTEYRTQNLWQARTAGAHRLVDSDSFSIDVAFAGGLRNAMSIRQLDTHLIMDHDLYSIKVANL